MTDLYSIAGTAQESIAALADNHEAQTLLAAEIAYSRGEIEKVYDSAYYLLHKHSGFYAVISAGMLLALCAIWRGDLNMWRQAKVHMSTAPAKTEADCDIVSFSITAIDSILYDKEREVAKLAAFGVKNGEIAKTLNMSLSAVKQAITNVSNKTGMTRENFAAIL